MGGLNYMGGSRILKNYEMRGGGLNKLCGGNKI